MAAEELEAFIASGSTDYHRYLGWIYARLGRTLRERFSGWRVGIVTSDKDLANATGLTFEPSGQPVLHGGLRVMLYRTGPLP